ncbi:MAG: choice-of-anchor Q domain-containing protein, partial [Pirellulales bacterium]
MYSLVGSNVGTNLVEAPVGSLDANGNLIGGPVQGVIDPMLGPLADNGGPTTTHALFPGSPAINRGDLNAVAGMDGVPLYDQRGEPFHRIVNGRIDIGAFEYQAPSDLNLLVDTLVDELDADYSRGDLSLREAIKLANTWSSTDTIRFDPALAGGTILLTMGDLAITDHTTIIGPASELLTIDASGSDPTPAVNDGVGKRIFSITGTANSRITVEIGGLILTGGDTGSQGGAIFSWLANLTLQEMLLTGNASRDFGGAIHSSNGNLILDSTIVSNNVANGRGGGVSLAGGSLTIDDSIISGNSAQVGGGVYFVDANSSSEQQLAVTRSSISGNQARNSGGGIWAALNGGMMTLSESMLENNTSGQQQQGSGSGGGIYAGLFNASTTISGGAILGNMATMGGGAFLQVNGGSLLITDTQVSDNLAHGGEGRGGGLHLMGQNGTTTIRNSTISGNQVPGNFAGGGGIFSRRHHLVIQSSTISDNTASRFGGGIYNRGLLEIFDSTISGNSSQIGGGIKNGTYGGSISLAIVRSTISNNTATGEGTGGGIHHSAGSLAITETTVSGNMAARLGGGIYTANNQGPVTVTASTLHGNSAGQDGGGIAALASNVTLVNSTLSANSAGGTGGGLWNRSATATLRHTTVFQNTASQTGGGVQTAGPLVLDHTIVAGNRAANNLPSDIAGSNVTPRYSLIGTHAGIDPGRGDPLKETPNGVPDAHGNLIGGPVHGVID